MPNWQALSVAKPRLFCGILNSLMSSQKLSTAPTNHVQTAEEQKPRNISPSHDWPTLFFIYLYIFIYLFIYLFVFRPLRLDGLYPQCI